MMPFTNYRSARANWSSWSVHFNGREYRHTRFRNGVHVVWVADTRHPNSAAVMTGRRISRRAPAAAA